MEKFKEIQKEKREIQQLLRKELERLQNINNNLQDKTIKIKENVEPELIIANNVKVMCDIYNTICQ